MPVQNPDSQKIQHNKAVNFILHSIAKDWRFADLKARFVKHGGRKEGKMKTSHTGTSSEAVMVSQAYLLQIRKAAFSGSSEKAF